QLDPTTGIDLGPLSFLLRPNGTASDSRTSSGSTVPANSVSFESPGQVLFSIDGAGALIGGIGSGSATAQTTLLPPGHPGFGQPEAIATQTVTDLKLYYRPSLLSSEGMSVQNISSTSKVESSTTLGIKATATTTLSGIRIWGTHDYDSAPGYVGVIKIDSITITAVAQSDGLLATSTLNWQWVNFRIWDPAALAYKKYDGTPDAPSTCTYSASGSTAPNPPCATTISIPAAYGVPAPGETYQNCSACSLAIVVGTSHVLTSPDGQLAQSSQRGLLTFYFKNQGLRPLETTIFTLGSATAEVTYRQHGH
ncbi:MAG: hypothetical protein ACRD1T_11525, partial [Acidimicrobiia bacterium]